MNGERRSHRLLDVAKVGIVALAAWGFSTQVDASSSHELDSRPLVGDPVDGASLYATGCSSCHGVDGRGVTTSDGQIRGVDITNAGAALAYFQLSTGRMPLGGSEAPPVRKPPVYDDEQIAALVDYVAAFGDGPPMPTVDIADADLARGGEIFRANCQACHSASGAGGALSYGESAPSLHDAEPLQVAAAVRSGPGRMPIFGPDVLDQQALNDVARYVEYLRDPEDPGGASLGRLGPVPEGFVALTLGIGVLLTFVFWIGTRSRVERRQQGDHP